MPIKPELRPYDSIDWLQVSRWVYFVHAKGCSPDWLDDRDLDDIAIVRIDFPELAWRHATGGAPLTRSYR